ncbi:uncharacterized protein N7473_003642 [Penicillium subrubescens]|uniref:uncharacterized protein n=1 Tax=Penicillium subrubescens TaxID=1316194 RepID=UPI002544E950|nr:uncharacterized protein N7473_003642 [Penicillium subrubescens]KAJ5906726.1 hypothetical protein N7473_003642 [Penicillium subrubescens]
MRNWLCYLIASLGLEMILATDMKQPDLARRGHSARRAHGSRPLQKDQGGSSTRPGLSSVEHIVQGALSSNWAGAVLGATITVPTPTPTGNSTSYQAASAWVGVDGATYITAILLNDYEWYPNFVLYYDEFAVNPGDVLVASVNVTSPKRGICIVENRTSGQSVTTIISAPKSTATLQGVNAE